MSKSKFYYQFDDNELAILEEAKIDQIVKAHPLFLPVVKAGKELNSDAYVIGGWVRDQLLNRSSKDVDIVTSQSGIELAKKTAQNLGNPKISIFKNFGTAMVKSKEIEYEFVGARKESYSKNSRKPEVEPGSIEDNKKEGILL